MERFLERKNGGEAGEKEKRWGGKDKKKKKKVSKAEVLAGGGIEQDQKKVDQRRAPTCGVGNCPEPRREQKKGEKGKMKNCAKVKV